MMKTEQAKKVIIKIESDTHQENVKTSRRTLKTLQHTATDKENLTGRTHILKDAKLALENETKKHKLQLMHKSTQTEKYITTVEDLTSKEPSIDYWQRLAEKRQESLDVSLHEIEKLKENIESLQEENKICKEMLEESKHLVEVLQEMINEGDDNESPDQEAKNQEENESS